MLFRDRDPGLLAVGHDQLGRDQGAGALVRLSRPNQEIDLDAVQETARDLQGRRQRVTGERTWHVGGQRGRIRVIPEVRIDWNRRVEVAVSASPVLRHERNIAERLIHSEHAAKADA